MILPFCDDTDHEQCNCSYVKPYEQPLQIRCFNLSDNCNWYHEINDILEQLPDMADSSRLSLPGNFDPNSYGIFSTNASNDSCYYAVIPPSNLGRHSASCTSVHD